MKSKTHKTTSSVVNASAATAAGVAELSVVIVTRNRAKILSRCLESLKSQTRTPKELIVVNNASTDQTTQVVMTFATQVSWPVRLVVETKIGYPLVYNRGLNEAKTDWVIFLDDDCVADRNWLAAYGREIDKIHPETSQIVALVGQSETTPPATVWALAVLAADQFWKFSALKANHEVEDLETLDNKNLAYFKPFLIQNQLSFNETTMSEPGGGAAEDADLGMQIQQAGGRAKFLPQAKIWHQDPNNCGWYWRRWWNSAVAVGSYRRRWKIKRQEMGLITRRPKLRFHQFWPKFCYQHQLTGGKAWLVWLIVQISFGLIKLKTNLRF